MKRIHIKWSQLHPLMLKGVVHVYSNKPEIDGKWNIEVTQHSIKNFPIESNKHLPEIYRELNEEINKIVRAYYEGLVKDNLLAIWV